MEGVSGMVMFCYLTCKHLVKVILDCHSSCDYAPENFLNVLHLRNRLDDMILRYNGQEQRPNSRTKALAAVKLLGLWSQ